MNGKQNLTVSLPRETLRKARILATQRGTSVSGLVAGCIEQMVGEEEAYEAARKRALEILAHGFDLGGTIKASRDEWHER